MHKYFDGSMDDAGIWKALHDPEFRRENMSQEARELFPLIDPDSVSVDYRLYKALSTAVHMIESNRREIAALAPKADAYERLGQVLDLAYDRGNTRGGYASVDPLYDLRWEMEKMEQRMQGEKQAAHEAQQARNDRPKG